MDFQQGHATSLSSSQMMYLQVRRCLPQELEDHVASADVLVPLMSRLDRRILEKASRAKLILQYGVGLEAVDIPAVCCN